MVTPLDCMTLFIFFLEIWEVAANWVFQLSAAPEGIRDNPEVSSWLQPVHLAWVLCATARLLLVRVAWAVAPRYDVYSYFAVAAAFKAQAAVNAKKQHEDALYLRASDNGNEAAMRPSRRRIRMVATAVFFHGVNAALVGRKHTEDRISTASSLAQCPSIYMATFYLARAACFPPKLPDSLPSSVG